MASSASDDLKIEIMVPGENVGDWGDKTNTNLRGIEEAICQTNDIAFAGTATVALSISNFSNPPQSGRGFRLNLTGTGTAGQILQVPDIQKSYIVNNGLSVDTIIKNSTAAPTVIVPAGKTAFVYSTSAGIVNSINTFTSSNVVGTFEISSNASVGGTLKVTGDTDVEDFSASGTLDVAGTTNLATAALTGTLSVGSNASVGGTHTVKGYYKNVSGNLIVEPATYIAEIRGGGSTEGQIQLNCRDNSHGQKIISQPHSEGVTNEMLLPKGANSTLVSEIGTATITNKTLTSPAINGATIDSAVSVSSVGTLNAGTNADINGTLDVGGNASVGGTFKITNNVTASGTLNVGTNASVTGTLAVTDTITGASTISDQDGNLRDIPLSTKVSGNYTLAIGDAGNQVTVNSANIIITVPDSVFAVGDIISIVSVNGCTATLACTAVNAVKAGDLAKTALHTLDANGVASIMFSYTADLAVLTGNIS